MPNEPQQIPRPPPAGLEVLYAEQCELRRERDALRHFLAALSGLVTRLDQPHRENEIAGLLEQTLDTTLQAIHAEGGSLLVLDNRSTELVFAMVRGEAGTPDLVGTRIPPGQGIAAWVARHRRPAVVNSTRDDERFYRDVDVRIAHHTRSVLAAPLIGGGELLGVIELVNRQGGRLFTTGNLNLLALLCRFAGELLKHLVRDIDLTQTITRNAIPEARDQGSGRQ